MICRDLTSWALEYGVSGAANYLGRTLSDLGFSRLVDLGRADMNWVRDTVERRGTADARRLPRGQPPPLYSYVCTTPAAENTRTVSTDGRRRISSPRPACGRGAGS